MRFFSVFSPRHSRFQPKVQGKMVSASILMKYMFSIKFVVDRDSLIGDVIQDWFLCYHQVNQVWLDVFQDEIFHVSITTNLFSSTYIVFIFSSNTFSDYLKYLLYLGKLVEVLGIHVLTETSCLLTFRIYFFARCVSYL